MLRTIQKHTGLCIKILREIFVYATPPPKDLPTINHHNNFSSSAKLLAAKSFCTYLPRVTKTSENELVDPLAEDNAAVSEVVPYMPPSFNFASYANRSPTLQKLVDMGVDLSQLEKRNGVPNFLVKLDFDRDMAAHIRFLYDHGVPAEEMGNFLTKNPLIFKVYLENLSVRIDYLKFRKFSTEMITRVVTANPYWLMFSVERIDRRLGYFQKTFHLSGSQVRQLATKRPQLITFNLWHVNRVTFMVKEEMGFDKEEIKLMLLKKPKLWMMGGEDVWGRFDYVHNVMKISHLDILDFPEVLVSRQFRIRQRHEFLRSLGRDQFDPKKEGYVSLATLVSGSDTDFCRDVAKTSVDAFNAFQKTL